MKDEKIRNKYNSYIIGRIINLIRIQIEDKNDNDNELINIKKRKEHPIYIFKKYLNIYRMN